MSAEAPPPPLQIPAAPYLVFVRARWCASVVTILAPEHPIGCPSDTAPPRGLSFSFLMLSFLLLMSATTLKASLISQKSISSAFSPAFLRAIGRASVGAIVKSIGFVAASA